MSPEPGQLITSKYDSFLYCQVGTDMFYKENVPANQVMMFISYVFDNYTNTNFYKVLYINKVVLIHNDAF